MASTMTMSPMRPSVPQVSSPLSGHAHGRTASSRPTPNRQPSFPSSRALRPFPSIAHALAPSPKSAHNLSSGQARGDSNTAVQAAPKKTTKIIEPPKNFKTTFVLNMTQAEFSRQE